MRVAIDRDRCVGHGRCYALAPEVFEPDDDGNGVVSVPEPGPELAEEAELGERNCPELAVTLSPTS